MELGIIISLILVPLSILLSKYYSDLKDIRNLYNNMFYYIKESKKEKPDINYLENSLRDLRNKYNIKDENKHKLILDLKKLRPYIHYITYDLKNDIVEEIEKGMKSCQIYKSISQKEIQEYKDFLSNFKHDVFFKKTYYQYFEVDMVDRFKEFKHYDKFLNCKDSMFDTNFNIIESKLQNIDNITDIVKKYKRVKIEDLFFEDLYYCFFF